MKWVNFLHFYQPPSINKETVDWVSERSYGFILKILKENKNVKITANINASLLEHLADSKKDLLADFSSLINEGRIELVLSAAYHPVLALIPYREAVRQINKDLEAVKSFFGAVSPRGFFFPEMVYDKRVAKYLKKIGIEWIILDELASGYGFNKVDYDKLYVDNNSGLSVVFSQRDFSNGYPPERILDYLNRSEDGIVVSATDAELYGDRHIDYDAAFYKTVNDSRVETVTVSDYLSSLKEKVKVKPLVSSWDTSEVDLEKGEELNLWNNPNNSIQLALWSLTREALKIVEANKQDDNYYWARWRLDKGLSSCVYWWASGKKVSSWDNLAWHPDQVEAGALDLIRSVRSLKKLSLTDRLRAEKKYQKVLKELWKTHWQKYSN